MGNDVEPVADDEFIYRRVPESMDWYDPVTRILQPEAFGPHKDRDRTGLSVTRARHKSLLAAAQGQPGRSYFVAVLRTGDLRRHGIEVVPSPFLPDGTYDAAHAELPDLNAGNRRTDQTLEWQRVLAEKLTLQVEGPFHSPVGDSA